MPGSLGSQGPYSLGAMADRLPDPTPSEARALILGAGTFWAGWGLGAATLIVNGSVIGLVPFFLGAAGGAWLHFGGVLRVAARQEGATTGLYLRRKVSRPLREAFGDRSGWSELGALAPSYFRRAARTLGWREGVVLGVLGILLAADLVVFVWMMATVPVGARR